MRTSWTLNFGAHAIEEICWVAEAVGCCKCWTSPCTTRPVAKRQCLGTYMWLILPISPFVGFITKRVQGSLKMNPIQYRWSCIQLIKFCPLDVCFIMYRCKKKIFKMPLMWGKVFAGLHIHVLLLCQILKRLAKNKSILRKYKRKGMFIDKVCGVVHCSVSVEVKDREV